MCLRLGLVSQAGVPRSDKYHKPKRADCRYVQGYLVPVLLLTVVQKNVIDG
jgi:hypothetical protein